MNGPAKSDNHNDRNDKTDGANAEMGGYAPQNDDDTTTGTPGSRSEGASDTSSSDDGARILELETQVADLNDRFLRAHAEMENLRKRTEREKADAIKYAITGFARDILGVSDNLKRALAAVPAAEGDHSGALKGLIEGVKLTEQELQNVLEKNGVRIIPALGEQFDPNLHQAMMEQENKDVAAGSVLQVFQDGYQISDRVLRPAMVVVAKGGHKPTGSAATREGSASRGINPGADKSDAGGASSSESDMGGSGRDGRPDEESRSGNV